MQIVFDAYRKTKELHHAYLIEGDAYNELKKVQDFLSLELGVTLTGNPDVWQGVYDTFGIDEGRAIRAMQSNKAVGGSRRFFIIYTRFFTHQAQNTLLKMFEEPSAGTHFFIVTPQSDVLLPTLRSRLFVVPRSNNDARSQAEITVDAHTFLHASIKDRLVMIEPIVKEKDTALALQLLGDIESTLSSNPDVMREHKDAIEDILYTRKALYGTAPSLKMLFEHLSCTLPKLA